MERTHRRPGLVRTILLVLLFLGTGALAAFGVSIGLRAFLPYESLGRSTAEERFLLWEGVMWMLGLAMVFFGGAGAFGTLHLIPLWRPSFDEIRSFAHDLAPKPYRGSLAPWWVLVTGAVLLVLAVHARAQLPG
jgi:hypothetical protein